MWCNFFLQALDENSFKSARNQNNNSESFKYFQLKLKQFTKHFDGKINTVKLGFKELFGHHKRVPYCKHLTIVPKGMKNQEKWLSFGFNTIINKKYQLNGPFL